ncbi:hypothetical protein [Haloquadratum walsbyi]|jgi:hypothetical protein|uniref:Uncharacterized protein n=1 Tax=Haloquadratum walsbyi J07HQW2 TaxID=1238425 RepID=U1NBM5_9EURY|nr:hypothetical protein [Haloquadratum walsbyi]ERG94290.1 MAG: hypothetical protein J07HQW2_00724 [Haloquadratum walsbyi J07HQW2]
MENTKTGIIIAALIIGSILGGAGYYICTDETNSAVQKATGTPDPGSPVQEATGTSTQQNTIQDTTATPTADFQSLTQEAINTPDPNKDINIHNKHSDAVELKIVVENPTTGIELYNDSFSIAPNSEQESVYNLKQLNPNGVQNYRVVAEYNNTRDSMTIRTNDCHSDANVEITKDGNLRSYYYIC